MEANTGDSPPFKGGGGCVIQVLDPWDLPDFPATVYLTLLPGVFSTTTPKIKHNHPPPPEEPEPEPPHLVSKCHPFFRMDQWTQTHPADGVWAEEGSISKDEEQGRATKRADGTKCSGVELMERLEKERNGTDRHGQGWARERKERERERKQALQQQ